MFLATLSVVLLILAAMFTRAANEVDVKYANEIAVARKEAEQNRRIRIRRQTWRGCV